MRHNLIIGVVGLGTMGLGIAQVFAAAGFRVLATDANAAARDSAVDRLEAQLNQRVAVGKLTAEDRDATQAALTVVPDIGHLAGAGLVIEAVIEDLAVKQTLFRDLEAILKPWAVLASNTSSIPIHRLADGLIHGDRLIGLHFFNPVPAMKLVELITLPGTRSEALDTANWATGVAGKTVISAPDRPGFIVNRCARPFYGEALALLEEGRSVVDIDGAMLAAGYRLGPFGLIDLIGADINLAATEGIWEAMARHPRYYPFAALRAQVASGNLGRKTGRGFVHPAIVPQEPDEGIVLRIYAAMINEACWLQEGETWPWDVDDALKLGLNFPRGPFETLRHFGKNQIMDILNRLEVLAPPHLKTRYLPAPYLVSYR